MNKGALALLIHGGAQNWSPERWKQPVRRRLRRSPGVAAARSGARSRRGPLRRGLETRPGRARGVSEPARHFQSRRRRRCADGRFEPARGAAGSRRGRRPHRPHDGICRAARADASPAGALFAGLPARATLGAEISMAGQRGHGRRHGARHARIRCRRRAAADRLSGGGLESKRPEDRGRRMLSRRGAARRVPAGGPISWSACCR